MLEAQQEAEGETEFEKEMLYRFEEYEQGKIIPLTLDELEERARKVNEKSEI